MKALLQPMAMPGQNECELQEFTSRLENLRRMYAEEAEFLEPVKPAVRSVQMQMLSSSSNLSVQSLAQKKSKVIKSGQCSM